MSLTALVLGAALFAEAADGKPVAAPGPGAPPDVEPPPVSVYSVSLPRDLTIIAVGGTVVILRRFVASSLARERCPCDPSTLNALDRKTVGYHSDTAGTVSDVSTVAIVAALPLLDWLDVGTTRALGEDIVVYGETLAIGSVIQNVVNFAVGRPRPRTYAGDPDSLHQPEGYLSFYAGHVSTVVGALAAGAYTVRRRHGELVWPWLVAAALSGSVAVERIAAGYHFPTDVAAGAAMGLALGVAIPWLHARPGSSPISLVPLDGGLALRGTF